MLNVIGEPPIRDWVVPVTVISLLDEVEFIVKLPEGDLRYESAVES